MLNAFKIQGTWRGIEYNHKGPAHLSIGQEAASVGQCASLEPDDWIFGSHRSHGEILAKCLSASRRLPERELLGTMERFLGGETLRVAEKIPHQGPLELAEGFILFGTLAEIFARKAGFNRGLGGSMHAFFTPFGSMPNKAMLLLFASSSALNSSFQGRVNCIITSLAALISARVCCASAAAAVTPERPGCSFRSACATCASRRAPCSAIFR